MLSERGLAPPPKPKSKKKKKPSYPPPERCRIKLIDFGLGGPPSKMAGFACGTPGYRAPEVTDYGECGYKSEVFSAGVCILELWVGHLWSDYDTDDEAKMARDRLDALAKLDRNDPEVARLIRKCVCKEPGDRPSAKQLQRALVGIRKNS